jgi:hypothetical protein
MKAKFIPAFLLFFTGAGIVTDWIIFSVRMENEKLSWPGFKLKYVNRFPEFLQPLVQHSLLFTLLCMSCFIIAGILFIKNRQKVFFILGIFSFILAFWQLFSIM